MGSGPWVLGLDSCPKGWAGVCWPGVGEARGVFGATVADAVEVAAALCDVAVVAIDIPLGLPDVGLPDVGLRGADILARRELGARRSSLFAAPVRRAVEASTYREAAVINRSATGKGLSAQAYALRAKILDADRFAPTAGVRVVEVHPELSFSVLRGAPLPHPKKSWNGMTARRELLAAVGLTVPSRLGRLGEVAAVDDVLDAAAAVWSASRVARGRARSVPDPPEFFSDGWPAAIWV